MITPVEHWEEPGDEHLAALLLEGPAQLAPLPGAFERLRRRTNRRRRLRTGAAGGATLAVVAAATVLLWPAAGEPAGPPMAPPAPTAAPATPAPTHHPAAPAPQPTPSGPGRSRVAATVAGPTGTGDRARTGGSPVRPRATR